MVCVDNDPRCGGPRVRENEEIGRWNNGGWFDNRTYFLCLTLGGFNDMDSPEILYPRYLVEEVNAVILGIRRNWTGTNESLFFELHHLTVEDVISPHVRRNFMRVLDNWRMYRCHS